MARARTSRPAGALSATVSAARSRWAVTSRRSQCTAVSQNIAKRISGHRTDSVFSRYDLVDEDDLADALATTQQHIERQRQDAPKVVPIHPAEAKR